MITVVIKLLWKMANFRPISLPPASEVCEGNVFTGVVCLPRGGGVSGEGVCVGGGGLGGGFLSRGSLSGGSLSGGSLSGKPPHTVKSRR